MARRRALSIGAPSRVTGHLASRLLRSALVLLAVSVVVLGGVSSYLTYTVVTVSKETETVTPLSSFQSSYINLNFTDRRGGEHEGWLLVGLKGAPAIILCHGYNSNRSELLALGNLLQGNHFNVYVFNFHAAKGRARFSDLGLSQAEDLMVAIDKVTKQPGVNSHRVGLYGLNSGGYAALAAAQQSPLVKALVADTIYDDPSQMFEAQVDHLLGGTSEAFRALPDGLFHLLTLRRPKPPVRGNMRKLEGMPKLYIQGRDSPLLARHTEALHDMSPPPKRLLVLDQSYTSLASGAVKKEYEDQVLSFFLQNLPLRAD
jgi:pimeloyl-ACP methyl ester carboxylesterase